MKGRRSKQYRKLMQKYGLAFGFREPYQVLVDARIIQDAERFKMDLLGGLERTLSGKVKPMITQCSIRHLYTLKDVPQTQKDILVSTAKTMERRRCNHHTLDEPLTTLSCLSSVVDPKNSLTNKNRYVLATQDEELRRLCRGVRGVPLVYVKRSVMVMEPMAEGSMAAREGMERSKFRSGLRGRCLALLGKRKRHEDNGSDVDVREEQQVDSIAENDKRAAKRKKVKGPKGPNPLSVKKPKTQAASVTRRDEEQSSRILPAELQEAYADAEVSSGTLGTIGGALDKAPNPSAKRKRKRRHKTKQPMFAAVATNNDAVTE